MDPSLEDRLNAVESSVAHLERQYDELNQMVVKQDKLLTRLSTMMTRMDSTFQGMEIDKIRNNNQKPPHYQ
ncbi:MAG: SlyX family protein [Verrucomicrobiia bacterium]|jgi:uncharacterized coiled-coil protein SlyX